MRCLVDLVLAACAATAASSVQIAAQQVPGRDLLHFPLGTMERPAALGGGIGDGLGNPATIVLDSGSRARFGMAALQTPTDQGVAAHLLSAAVGLPEQITVGLSVARFAVDGIFRTDTDPQTIGGRVPYGTTVYTASIARRHGSFLSAGVAARYRRGEMDREARGAIGLDAGILAERLPYRDASVGVASFMWRPANAELERTSLNLAADLRLFGSETRRQLRVGYGITLTEGRQREELGILTARFGVWDVRAGMARNAQYGLEDWRPRFAVGIHYDRYEVRVAREANGAGLEPIYQFSLSAKVQ